ncbi:hypothetical protein PSEUDO9AG_50336 [Pseudomonas sp. 9Ag]|nr:hypothetical protein PSEUDO9AG_50336 [Pseudomonas sp. 9Ag]
MQLVLVRLMQQVQHRRVLRVGGGTDAAGGLVEHKEACRFAGLQHLAVQLDTVEDANVMGAVADSLSIHRSAARRQQQARLAMAAMGQVGEEAVEAHYGFAGDSPRAQRGQMQALFSASSGMRSWASAAISAVKHQHGCVAVAGFDRLH